MSHHHKDILQVVPAIDQPLPICPASGTRLEPHTDLLLHRPLQGTEGLLGVELGIVPQRCEHGP